MTFTQNPAVDLPCPAHHSRPTARPSAACQCLWWCKDKKHANAGSRCEQRRNGSAVGSPATSFHTIPCSRNLPRAICAARSCGVANLGMFRGWATGLAQQAMLLPDNECATEVKHHLGNRHSGHR